MESNVNNPKRRAKHRNYDVQPLPIIPGVPENATHYRPSPSELRQTLLLFSTSSSPHELNSPLPSPSPVMSPLFPLLSLVPLESPDASEPQMNLLTESLGRLDVIQNKRKYLTKSERLDIVLRSIDDQFKSLGHFFEALTQNVPRDDPDPRSEYHKRILSSWLGGRGAFRPVHLVEAIYRNRYSVPSSKSVEAEELSYSFHATRNPEQY
ncbi:hypothetical protein K438DRAFT_2001810 [Mycena galopus ATCC 62051]|nr:hypothetical protein K438DRAFT_2001810 [Mycena galopus ATCC 62051]